MNDFLQWLIQKIPKGGAPNLGFSQTVGGGGFVSRVIYGEWVPKHIPYLISAFRL